MNSVSPRLLTLLTLWGPALLAQTTPTATVQITATKFPEDPAKVPASVTVITSQELADRGATDLRSALALVAGLNIAPGGDGGPASSVPAFWGLREMDAFLLVVDGVPWGGTFNPALATLDLQDVERIEIQKGAAPVMYGATSFVGVIHVIHHAPGDVKNSALLSLGDHGSHAQIFTLKMPSWAGFDSSLTADSVKQGFVDPRTQFERNHILWRNRMTTVDGSFHFDVDAGAVHQNPGSPHLREGKALSTDVPVDGNHNPDGAFLKENRVTLTAGYDRRVSAGVWSTLVSVARSRQNDFRGFLSDPPEGAPDPEPGTHYGHAFRLRVESTNLYFDTHFAGSLGADGKYVLGLDHLHGAGSGQGGDFDYLVNLDGSNAHATDPSAPAPAIRIDDRRDFSGLYAFAEATFFSRLTVEAGARLNRTEEARTVAGEEGHSSDKQSNTRFTASAGLSWAFWQSGTDRVGLFANGKNAFKPAAIDFGLDSEGRILDPETAHSYEVGLKGNLLNGRLSFEVDAFQMDFSNLVVPKPNGVLENAGRERFEGVEGEVLFRFLPELVGRASLSYHDTRFTDYAKDFGSGTLTQLAGKRLEMSPYQMGAIGLVYAPAKGLTASVDGNYVGAVYLNQRNTAPSGAYTTLAASLGYRTAQWEFRLTGQNLTDKRNPVAESELGDAQYYRLPGRQVDASVRFRF